MNKTGRTALCGVLSAAAVVIMLLTGVVTIGTFALPAVAGILSMIAVIECNTKYGTAIYIVSSILSFILAPDKEAALYYIAFFGYYPVIKSVIERKNRVTLQWVLKYAVFNMAMILCFFASVYVLSVPKDSFTIFGYYLPIVFLLVGNVVFILYDKTLTSLVTMYLRVWRKHIFKGH